MLNVFVRMTILITLGIVAMIVLLFVLKVVIFAAIVAGLIIAGLFAINFFRRSGAGGVLVRTPRNP